MLRGERRQWVLAGAMAFHFKPYKISNYASELNLKLAGSC